MNWMKNVKMSPTFPMKSSELIKFILKTLKNPLVLESKRVTGFTGPNRPRSCRSKPHYESDRGGSVVTNQRSTNKCKQDKQSSQGSVGLLKGFSVSRGTQRGIDRTQITCRTCRIYNLRWSPALGCSFLSFLPSHLAGLRLFFTSLWVSRGLTFTTTT